MKKALSFILLVVMLGACGQQNNESNDYAERDEGVIVNIEKDTDNAYYRILTLPSVESINILDKSRDELIKLAQEYDGAFYKVSQEQYEEWELEIGQRIAGYYNSVGESDPPVFYINKIEVISER